VGTIFPQGITISLERLSAGFTYITVNGSILNICVVFCPPCLTASIRAKTPPFIFPGLNYRFSALRTNAFCVRIAPLSRQAIPLAVAFHRIL
jgi:hypothetical protein